MGRPSKHPAEFGHQRRPGSRLGGDQSRTRPCAALVIAAACISVTACAPTHRVLAPGGKRVNVQRATVGVTLRTDRHNTVTVTEYRPAVPTINKRAPAGQHFEAAEVRVCAPTSGGLVTPAQATLSTGNHTRVQASADEPLKPTLKARRLVPGRCTHGWVGFKVPNTTTGSQIIISDDNDDSLRWHLH